MGRDFSGRKGKRGGFAGAPAAVVCNAILLLFAISASVSATDTQEMPGEIVIDNKVYKTDRKASRSSKPPSIKTVKAVIKNLPMQGVRMLLTKSARIATKNDD